MSIRDFNSQIRCSQNNALPQAFEQLRYTDLEERHELMIVEPWQGWG